MSKWGPDHCHMEAPALPKSGKAWRQDTAPEPNSELMILNQTTLPLDHLAWTPLRLCSSASCSLS